MMLMPVLMSGVSFLITKSPYTLIMAAGMPMMMLANATGSRRQMKKRYDEQVADYRKRRINVETAAVSSLVGERGTRRRNFPDPATVLLFATGPRARLWERRPWDRDFLHLRLGTDDLPSDVTIKDPTRDAHEGPLLWTAPDVPVTIPLREAGVVGIAGTAEECRSVAMWTVAQVAALHSPSDAIVGVLLGSEPEPRLGLGEVAAARAQRRRPPAAGPARDRRGQPVGDDLRADGRARGPSRARREAGGRRRLAGSSCSTVRARSG